MTRQGIIAATLLATGCAAHPLTASVSAPASANAPEVKDFPPATVAVAQPTQVTFKGTVCTANTNGLENLRRYGLYAGGALTLYCRN